MSVGRAIVGAMNELIEQGEERHCPDCRADTVFLRVETDGWVCTACDGALTFATAA